MKIFSVIFSKDIYHTNTGEHMGKDDLDGEPVSKEEILKELGDPAEWSKLHRKLEFEKRLRFGQKELDISGIKGAPGMPGYLDFLNEEFKHPLGSGTGLVSELKNCHIKEQEQEAVRDEIGKYSKLLKRLEKSPAAVGEYLNLLKKRLEDFEHSSLFGDLPLDNFGDDEEGYAMARKHNRERKENIGKLKEEIIRYSALLEKLKSTA